MKVLLFSSILFLIIWQGQAHDVEIETLDTAYKTLIDVANMLDIEVPPYNPQYPGIPDVDEPGQKLPQYPSKPWWPYTDDKWKKCCKLEEAKECCLEKARNLPLYNLGTGIYYFHNDMSTPKNWYDALHFCRAHGMELVSIETASENSMLQSYVQWFLGGTADFYSFYWTSLNDLGAEGTFTWAGTGQTASYFSWHLSGQPDGGVWENCGEMWQTTVGTVLWNDRDCLKWRGRFICEMSKLCVDIINAGYE